MATVTAVATGNWSNAAIWSSNPALPQSGDLVRAATYTVTIDQDVNIGTGTLDKNNTGYFVVPNTGFGTRTITANVTATTASGSGGTLDLQHVSGNTVVVNGNVTGGSTNNNRAINNTSTGALTVNGVVTGGTSSLCAGIYLTGTGTVTVNGNCVGGGASDTGAIHIGAAATVNVTGTVRSLTGGYTIYQNNSTSSVTVTGNVGGVGCSGTTIAITGGTLVINGVVTGGNSGSSSTSLVISGSAIAAVTINGNVQGGAASYGFGISMSNSNAASTLNVVGNVTAGNGGNQHAISGGGNVIITITGNVYGSSTGDGGIGITVGAANTVTVNGNVFGGTNGGNSHGIQSGNNGTLIVNGSATGGVGATSAGIDVPSGAGTITVNGSIAGGSGASSGRGMNVYGGTSTIVVNGNSSPGVTTSSSGHGLSCSVSGPNITINGKAIGSGYGNGSGSNIHATIYGVQVTHQNCFVKVKGIQYGTLGFTPTFGNIKIVPDSNNNQALFIRSDNDATLTLTDANTVLDFPTIENVRYGTSYKNGDLVGTLRVPTASQVQLGVLVDNTTGTAVLTQADVQAAMTAQGYTTARGPKLDYLTMNVSDLPTAAEITDALWDEPTSGHATAGSTGKALIDAGAVGDPLSSAVPGSYAAGTAGYQIARIGAAGATVTTPVTQTGDINIKRGDDYNLNDARQIAFVFAGAPSITGATLTFKLAQPTQFTKVMTITSSTTAYVELTSAQTAAMVLGAWAFEVQGVLVTSARVVTLMEGTCTITGDL